MNEDFPLFVQVPMVMFGDSYFYRVVSGNIKRLRDCEKSIPGAKFYFPPKGSARILSSKSKPFVLIPSDKLVLANATHINEEYSMIVQWVAKEEWYRQFSGSGLDDVGQKKFDNEILAKIRILLYKCAWTDFPETEDEIWLNEYIKNRTKLREIFDRVQRSPLNFSSQQRDSDWESRRPTSRRERELLLQNETTVSSGLDPSESGDKPRMSFEDFLKTVNN